MIYEILVLEIFWNPKLNGVSDIFERVFSNWLELFVYGLTNGVLINQTHHISSYNFKAFWNSSSSYIILTIFRQFWIQYIPANHYLSCIYCLLSLTQLFLFLQTYNMYKKQNPFVTFFLNIFFTCWQYKKTLIFSFYRNYSFITKLSTNFQCLKCSNHY